MKHIKLYENFITEKKSTGVIYHYTTPHGLKSILAQDKMTSGHQHISFSRNYDLKTWWEDYGAICRITFDGSDLSNKFSIAPHLFDPTKDVLFGGGTVSDIVQRRKYYGAEREEMIKGEEIKGIKKYIMQIDILEPEIHSETDLKDIKVAERNNPDIKISRVKKFAPVRV